MNVMTRFRGAVLITWGLLLLGLSPIVQAAAFTDASLTGDYGFADFHFNSSTTQPTVQAVGAKMLAPKGFVEKMGTVTFDGIGGFTRTYDENVDGAAASTSDDGTYTVAADGSFSMTFTSGDDSGVTITGHLSADGSMTVSTSGVGTDPRFAITGKKQPGGSYDPAVLNDQFATIAGYGYVPGSYITQPSTPAAASPMPAPKGFLSFSGVVYFAPDGEFLMQNDLNMDGVVITATFTGIYIVDTDGVVAMTTDPLDIAGVGTIPTQTFTGNLVNGNTLVMGSAYATMPQLVAASLITQDGFDNTSLKGRFSVIQRYFDSAANQPNMPAQGASQPTPIGFDADLGTLTADGNGNWSATFTTNVDGVAGSNSISGTYSVADDGTLLVLGPNGTILNGQLQNGGNNWYLVSSASKDPQLVYAAKIPSATTTRYDLDGDGKADIVWRNTGTGGGYAWLMNGMTIASQGYLPTVADTTWQIVSLGDLDGDGKADVLWHNTVSGQNYAWLMNGMTIASQGYLPTVADTTWQIVGLGDLDGDGKADVLWHNTVSGQNYAWLMNGMTIASQGYLPTVADTTWQIVSLGDLDGDGKADVLWHNTVSGQNYAWLMNGMTIAGQGYLPTVADTTWQIVSLGDLDGDGKADVLWHNTVSGQNYAWLMNGMTIAGQGYLPTVADTTWQIVSLGDLDGDGKADVLWHNTVSGQNYAWLMNGMTIAGQGYLPTVADTTWQIINK